MALDPIEWKRLFSSISFGTDDLKERVSLDTNSTDVEFILPKDEEDYYSKYELYFKDVEYEIGKLIGNLQRDERIRIMPRPSGEKEPPRPPFQVSDKYFTYVGIAVRMPRSDKTRRINKDISDPKVLLHIELDDFPFCALEQKNDQTDANPDLLVILEGFASKYRFVHADELMTKRVLFVSKLAKKFGIKAGMTYFEARQLCEDIDIPNYQMKMCTKTCEKFFRGILKLKYEIEIVSCWEALIDVSAYVVEGFLRGRDGLDLLVSSLQLAIYKATDGLTSTVGAGKNRFLARLACRQAKRRKLPFYYLQNDWVDSLMKLQPIGELPLTRSTAVEFKEFFNLKTCLDIQRMDSELRKKCGIGERIFQLAHGHDDDSLNTTHGHTIIIIGELNRLSFGGNNISAKFHEHMKQLAKEATKQLNSSLREPVNITMGIEYKMFQLGSTSLNSPGTPTARTRSPKQFLPPSERKDLLPQLYALWKTFGLPIVNLKGMMISLECQPDEEKEKAKSISKTTSDSTECLGIVDIPCRNPAWRTPLELEPETVPDTATAESNLELKLLDWNEMEVEEFDFEESREFKKGGEKEEISRPPDFELVEWKMHRDILTLVRTEADHMPPSSLFPSIKRKENELTPFLKFKKAKAEEEDPFLPKTVLAAPKLQFNFNASTVNVPEEGVGPELATTETEDSSSATPPIYQKIVCPF